MSDHKYFRYTLRGEVAPHEAIRKLGDAAAEGVIVRVENKGGQTHVYLASKKALSVPGAEVAEVSEKDVTTLGK